LIAPPEKQPRRNEEVGLFAKLSHSLWLIFILFSRVAALREGLLSDIDTTFKRRDHNG
jgi:hypothetical protein